MSSLFNLMIDDIIISEADFSNDALSQCQFSECPPTELFSAIKLKKPANLNTSIQYSNEDFSIEKMFNSPLSSQHTQKTKRNHQTKKSYGRVAWALFEEEESTAQFLDDENDEIKKKQVEWQRRNICTSEFLLDDGKDSYEALKPIKSSSENLNIHISNRNQAKMEFEPINFDEFTTPIKSKRESHTKKEETPKSNQLVKRTIKKSSMAHNLKTPKNSNFQKWIDSFVLTKHPKQKETRHSDEIARDDVNEQVI